MNKLIFVGGTGRSGTHLVGRSIASHPEIDGRIEDTATFDLVTKIATTQDYGNRLYTRWLRGRLLRTYEAILEQSSSHVLEKSHPSIWLADALISGLKNAFHVGVWREVEPTVNSMLQHSGVLSWYERLPQRKVNRFLGITEENKKYFSELTIEEKCALRWLSHKKELDRLRSQHPSKIMLVKYDDFLREPEPHLKSIAELIGVSNEFSPEKFRTESLDRWKNELSECQLARIRTIISEERNEGA
jgi:hypothetical protein